ncbi:MAG: hypothetical protein ABI579_01910 [Candidatus Sumerlaeota bacterium]
MFLSLPSCFGFRQLTALLMAVMFTASSLMASGSAACVDLPQCVSVPTIGSTAAAATMDVEQGSSDRRDPVEHDTEEPDQSCECPCHVAKVFSSHMSAHHMTLMRSAGFLIPSGNSLPDGPFAKIDQPPKLSA